MTVLVNLSKYAPTYARITQLLDDEKFPHVRVIPASTETKVHAIYNVLTMLRNNFDAESRKGWSMCFVDGGLHKQIRLDDEIEIAVDYTNDAIEFERVASMATGIAFSLRGLVKCFLIHDDCRDDNGIRVGEVLIGLDKNTGFLEQVISQAGLHETTPRIDGWSARVWASYKDVLRIYSKFAGADLHIPGLHPLELTDELCDGLVGEDGIIKAGKAFEVNWATFSHPTTTVQIHDGGNPDVISLCDAVRIYEAGANLHTTEVPDFSISLTAV